MAKNLPKLSTSDEVRRRMAAQRTRDTACELEIRRALHAAGFRYRINYPVPSAPRRTIDIAFTKRRVAVFIDGCFWHCCPVHSVPVKNNSTWWARKLARNAARDEETTRLLQELGWLVVRVWEHDDPAQVVAKVLTILASAAERSKR